MKTIVLLARVVIIIIVALVVLRFVAAAQQPQPDMTIDAATRSAVIDKLLAELKDSYVFAETTKKMEADIRARIANKEYDSVTAPRRLRKSSRPISNRSARTSIFAYVIRLSRSRFEKNAANRLPRKRPNSNSSINV